MLMLQLFPEDFPRLAQYCLCHDVPEAWVGDVPAHTKHRAPAIAAALQEMENGIFTRLQLPNENDLDEEDRVKLKACDALELWFWAREQLLLGNHHAIEVYEKLNGWFNKGQHRALPPPAFNLWSMLRKTNYQSHKSLAMDDY